MGTIRLAVAQLVVRFLAAQRAEIDGVSCPLFAGVWAIFGQGIVGCP
jgi:3D-(3,5/4)-trihydroxycyclohexane-1,2-dione acylhydrolase (decyclizing)